MKQCPRCGAWKHESDFNWRYKDKEILQSVCRDCQRFQQREHYERNAEDIKEKAAETRQRARNEAQRYIYEVLGYSVCADCGEYDFTVLTFHHVRGKKRKDISTMAAQGYSIQAIQEEINKCIILCFNCHMRREAEERTGGRFRRFWPKMPWENDE